MNEKPLWFRLSVPRGSAGDWVVKRAVEKKLLDSLLSPAEFEVFGGKDVTYMTLLLSANDVKAVLDSIEEAMPKSAAAGIEELRKSFSTEKERLLSKE